MNIPNSLTLMRIFVVPLLVAALVTDSRTIQLAGWSVANEQVALAIFLLAAATDFLDGYLARRWKQTTTVGTLLDPIADKLLISSALVSLVQVHVIPGWMAILVISREFAVTGLRSIAAASGITIKASDLGKTKMLAQVIATSLLMLGIHNQGIRPYAMFWMWGVVVVGVVSAVQYFWKFWRELDLDIKMRRRQELLELEREQRAAKAIQRKAASVRGTD